MPSSYQKSDSRTGPPDDPGARFNLDVYLDEAYNLAMEINPYQAPTTEAIVVNHEYDLYAQPPYLVVRSGATLPPRCVLTNEPIGEDQTRQRLLRWSGNSFHLVLTATSCQLRFGISRRLQRRENLAYLISIGCTLALVSLIIGATVFSDHFDANGHLYLPLILVSLVGMIAGVLIKQFSVRLPFIVDHDKGYFWIQGCCADYVAATAAELEQARGGEAGAPPRPRFRLWK